MTYPQPFTGVLFDLDDTLNDRSASLHALGRAMLEEFAGRFHPTDADTVHKIIVQADHGGYCPKDQRTRDLLTELPWRHPPTAPQLDAFWAARYAGCTVERTGAKPLLRALRTAGFRLGIVSNGGTLMQNTKIQQMDLEPMVDMVVISESFGHAKPHAPIFQHALDQLACNPQTVLFVGDNPNADVLGAAKLGMRTAWLANGPPWPADVAPPDYIITALDELRTILQLPPAAPTLQRITREIAPLFKTVRLAALHDSPLAFGSTFANESTFSDARWLQRATEWNTPRCAGYIALDANLGCGIAAVFLAEDDPKIAHLVSMWVAPTHRRTGLGRTLIDAIAAWSAAQGAHTLLLTVTSCNQIAIDFYRRLGFTMTGITHPYPNDPALFEHEMSRPVAPL